MSKVPVLDGGVNLFGQGEGALATSILVGGRAYDIGTPVCHWWDPGGLDGYVTDRVVAREQDRRSGKVTERVIQGQRYSARRIEGVTQFVVHHSGGDGPTPATMYRTLWYERGLSVQFACEDDGRIWQFIDAREGAWHAGKHNKISIGVEAALFPLVNANPHYYDPDQCRARGNQPHAQRTEVIQGCPMRVFVMPPPQVFALVRLVAGTWAALRHETGLPQFEAAPRFPRLNGAIPMSVIERPLEHVGLIGHLHCTAAKIDPAGFPWEEFEAQVGQRFAEAAV